MKSTLQMSQKLRNLRNIFITDVEDSKNACQIIQNVKELNHLYIGEQFTNKNLNPEIIQEIANKKNLQTLYLSHLNIFFEQQSSKKVSLIDVFKNKNNKQLRTIFFDKCQGVSDDLIKCIGQNCLNIKQLIIYDGSFQNKPVGDIQNDLTSIKQFNFQLMKGSLQTLTLHYCYNIKSQIALQKIKSLKKLKYLNLHWNKKWVNDKIMQEIGNHLTQLKFLNIESNDVTDQGIVKIRTLRKLRTLICGMNKISGQGLLKMLQGYNEQELKLLELELESKKGCKQQKIKQKFKKVSMPLLTKFSIDWLNGQNYGLVTKDNIKKINMLLDYKITHFSAWDCFDFDMQVLREMKNLKCLVINLDHFSNEQIKQLQKNQVNVSQAA